MRPARVTKTLSLLIGGSERERTFSPECFVNVDMNGNLLLKLELHFFLAMNGEILCEPK